MISYQFNPIARMIAATTAITASLWGMLISLSSLPAFATAVQQPEAYQNRLVEWISKDPDGFFHPSVQFQRLGPDGKSGPYSMHATEDIPKGTPLIVLPRKYVIESGMEQDFGVKFDEDDYRSCVTVRKMLREYYKTTDPSTPYESFYAPYLSYLFEDTVGGTTRGLLPTTWSENAKELLGLILLENGDIEGEFFRLRPQSYEYNYIADICSENVERKPGIAPPPRPTASEEDEAMDMELPIAQDAFIFLLSRGWYDKALPVVDMLNHRNGRHKNVEVTPIGDVVRTNDVAAYAIKDIKKGEQLQYTYTECLDKTCHFGGIRYYATTQFLFAEYGFVELYPRRWAFDIPIPTEPGAVDDENEVICEIDTDPEDESKLVFRWIWETPTKADIIWMQKEFDRLKSIEGEVRKRLEQLESGYYPPGYNVEHEKETIEEYYEAYLEAFEVALEHKDDPVGLTKADFDQEIKEIKEASGKIVKTIQQIKEHELISGKKSIPKSDEL